MEKYGGGETVKGRGRGKGVRGERRKHSIIVLLRITLLLFRSEGLQSYAGPTHW